MEFCESIGHGLYRRGEFRPLLNGVERPALSEKRSKVELFDKTGFPNLSVPPPILVSWHRDDLDLPSQDTGDL